MPSTAPTASAKATGGPSAKPDILNHYTTLPFLIDILQEKHITLRSPETWEDRNDAYYLERYQQEMKLGSVQAICFSLSGETFHHWRVFSSGSSGVCISFDKDKLLNSLAGQGGFHHQPVVYRLVKTLTKNRPPVESWPFLKRNGFRHEEEYRIIFDNDTPDVPSKSIQIDLSSIRRITLSPWLPSSIAPAVIAAVKRIDGCASIKLRTSSLIENADWRAAISK